VNGWYDEIDDTDGSFAARLHSEDDVAHHQALDELHVHHLLRAHHDDVRYEEFGAGPDFRVYDSGDCIGAVEVLSLFEQREWTEERLRHERLADAIRVAVPPTHGFMIMFDIDDDAPGEPIPRRYLTWLGRELDALPSPEHVAAEGHVPERIFVDGEMRILTRFLPARADGSMRTDPDAEIIVTGGVIGGVVVTPRRLRERIEAKVRLRYELKGAPFLVACNMRTTFDPPDGHDAMAALYGNEGVDIATGEVGRHGDGAFRSGSNTSVAAVVAIRNSLPWSPVLADVALYHNPFASNRWPSGILSPTREFGPVSDGEQSVRYDWRDAGG
jgi:hypothetical protein